MTRHRLDGSVNGLDENYKESGTGLFNSNQWTERVDYTLNEKMHAFERFSRFWDTLSGAVMFGPAGGPGFGIGNYGGNPTAPTTVWPRAWISRISPKLLTDFRLGYYRYNVIDTKHDQGAEFANTLGIPGINTGAASLAGAPGFNITNFPAAAAAPTARCTATASTSTVATARSPSAKTSSRSSTTGPDHRQPRHQGGRRPSLRPQPARSV